MASHILKYNPAFMTDEQLIASFAIRKTDLDLLLQTIRDNTADSNQHVLVLGPRGMGKTTLVLRVVAEVRRDAELSGRWYPIVFSEESYSVDSVGAFWLEALFHLAIATNNQQLRETHAELLKESNDERLRDRALAQLLDFADSQKKRLLLIVENFNMLVGDQMSDAGAWELRHTLLNEPRLMLLATATTQPEEMSRQDKALYELLKPHELKTLTLDETVSLWAVQTGKSPSPNGIKPLHILTGGNPRLLSILSSFAATLSLREVMDNLLGLVDDHTDYFKSHIESLPATERRVYTTLADLWDPSTAQTVAQNTRLSINMASALLNRLVARGFVVIAAKEGRSKWYQVAERLYNVYYLLRRRGSCEGRIQAVVRFMTSYYASDELCDVVHRMAEEAGKLATEARADYYRLFRELIAQSPDDKSYLSLLLNIPLSVLSAPDAPETLRSLTASRANIEADLVRPYVLALESADIDSLQHISDDSANNDPQVRLESLTKKYTDNAYIWLMFGYWHVNSHAISQAEQAFRKAIECDGSFCLAWLALGNILVLDGDRIDEAEAAYRQCLALNASLFSAWYSLGKLHLFLKKDPIHSRDAFTKAAKIAPSNPLAWAMLGLAYWRSPQPDITQAERSLLRCIELLSPDHREIKEPVLNTLCDIYEKSNRPQKEVECRQQLAELFPENASHWILLGCVLHSTSHLEESIHAFRRALAVDPQSQDAWHLLALTLCSKEDRLEEAEQAFREALRISPKDADTWGMFGGFLQVICKRSTEACEAFRNSALLDATVTDWDMLFQAHTAADKDSEAIALAEEVLREATPDPKLFDRISRGLLSVNELDRALPLSQKAISLAPNQARFLWTYSSILVRQGRLDDACRSLETALADAAGVDKEKTEWITLFIELAAKGGAANTLAILRKSACAEILEPLVVALRLYVGENVKVAAEIEEVAKDIVARITSLAGHLKTDVSVTSEHCTKLAKTVEQPVPINSQVANQSPT
jgi:tetratricopeptide (TPR) repeat protein